MKKVKKFLKKYKIILIIIIFVIVGIIIGYILYKVLYKEKEIILELTNEEAKELINNNYLYYYLQSKYKELRRISSGDGTRGGLNLKMIGDYEVELPSLEEQQRIVNILDKFDKIVNDINEGIPAEIEMRRKQYEYYRNKLLSFKEVK